MESERSLKAHLIEFFELFSEDQIHQLFVKKKTTFARVNGLYSSVVAGGDPVILIYPDLLKSLRSAYNREALAILAHEVGHIHNGHFERKVGTIEAQVEADLFACELGLSLELSHFLDRLSNTWEIKIRQSYITSYYYSNEFRAAKIAS